MKRIKIEAIARLINVTPAGTWRDEYKNRTGINECYFGWRRCCCWNPGTCEKCIEELDKMSGD